MIIKLNFVKQSRNQGNITIFFLDKLLTFVLHMHVEQNMIKKYI